MNTDASDRLALSAAFGPHLFALLTEPPVAVAAEGLVIGVLRQAVHDLRKFRSATRGVERDLYLEAYSWIMADDSFGRTRSLMSVNYCKSPRKPSEPSC